MVGGPQSAECAHGPLRGPEARYAGRNAPNGSFLGIPIDETRWDRIVEYCQFEWMKANAKMSGPLGGVMWDGGTESFIHKGVNGRWTDTLTAEDRMPMNRAQSRNLEKIAQAG